MVFVAKLHTLLRRKRLISFFQKKLLTLSQGTHHPNFAATQARPASSKLEVVDTSVLTSSADIADPLGLAVSNDNDADSLALAA